MATDDVGTYFFVLFRVRGSLVRVTVVGNFSARSRDAENGGSRRSGSFCRRRTVFDAFRVYIGRQIRVGSHQFKSYGSSKSAIGDHACDFLRGNAGQ